MLVCADKEQSIRIQSSGGLTEDQIQQMVRDAEAHAEKDKQRKEMIEVGKPVQGGRGIAQQNKQGEVGCGGC